MQCNLREVAKFGAGVAAWESVVHLSFAVSRVLPLKLVGVTITPSVNRVQILRPAAAAAVLAYYAWCSGKRPPSERAMDERPAA